MGMQEMHGLVELGAMPVIADAAIDKRVAVFTWATQIHMAQLADIFCDNLGQQAGIADIGHHAEPVFIGLYTGRQGCAQGQVVYRHVLMLLR